MAGTIPLSTALESHAAEDASAKSPSIPWYIWANVVAVSSSVIGGVWDISWHESVGRDTFWTAAHMLIYLCGVLSGLTCGYLILRTTFDKDCSLREHSVSMWGFRGPFGAFLCAWGAVAMITSGPFDNWWHNAYGLDVKILSPPHILLALGMTAIRFGTLVMVLAEVNRAVGSYRVRLECVLYFCFAVLLAMTVGIMQEDTFRMFMHGARFYLVVMCTAPIWFAAVSRAAQSRWAATIATGFYIVLHLSFMWILQLVPAQPRLGPVYQNITHLVPPDFPLLILVPAIVFDLLRRYTGAWRRFTQSVVLGAACLGSFLAVQWPFADFLMSPASRNWFFATNNLPYFVPPGSHWARYAWVPTEATAEQFALRMTSALLAAVVTIVLGFSWGDWMNRLRR